MKLSEHIFRLEARLYVSVEYLTDELGISRNTYDKWVQRDQVRPLLHPQNRTKRIVEYASLPVSSRSSLPTEEEVVSWMVREQMEAAERVASLREGEIRARVLQAYEQEWQLYKPHYFPDITTVPRVAEDLARCCAVFEIGMQIMRDKPRGYMPYLTDYSEAIQPLPLRYLRATNVNSLRQRIKKALDKDLTAWQEIRLPNAGNDNAVKMTIEHQAIIYTLFAHETKTSNKKVDRLHVHEVYKWIIDTQLPELAPAVDYSTVKRFLGKPATKAMTTQIRSGNKRYRELWDMYHHRHRPAHSLTLIAGDGIPLAESVTYTQPIRTTSGNMRHSGQLTAWLWYDVHSGAIVSWSIGYAEKAESIRLSLRDIPLLHGGRMPRSVYIDKMWSERASVGGVIKAAGIHIQDKAAYNPQENPAENFNRALNVKIRQVFDRYATITNHHDDFKHNDDFIRNSKKRTEEELRADIKDVIARYNKDKWPALQNYDPKCKVLSHAEQLFAFGGQRETIVDRGRFKLHVEHAEYHYEVEEWAKMLHLLGNKCKVRVRFDERYLKEADSQVSLWQLDKDEYIGMASRAGSYNMAQVDMTAADRAEMKRQAAMRKAFNEGINAEKTELDIYADSMDVLGMLEKADQLITKEAMAGMRSNGYGGYIQDEEPEPERIPVAAIPKGAPDAATLARMKYERRQKALKGGDNE